MHSFRGHLMAVIAAAVLAACGSDSTTPSPTASDDTGTLVPDAAAARRFVGCGHVQALS